MEFHSFQNLLLSWYKNHNKYCFFRGALLGIHFRKMLKYINRIEQKMHTWKIICILRNVEMPWMCFEAMILRYEMHVYVLKTQKKSEGGKNKQIKVNKIRQTHWIKTKQKQSKAMQIERNRAHKITGKTHPPLHFHFR